ncbi:V-type ATP synthase beta chain [Rhodococcus sp. AW25M09]|nr:V-type ATP synthase beta chain [Rhodococcus sp. AW25M09]
MIPTTRALTVPNRRWPWLGAVCAGVSINAFGAAIGVASGAIDLGADAQARLPMSSPALAGLALVLVVGVPMGLAAASALAGGGKSGPIAHMAGVLLAAWVVISAAVLGETSWIQALFGVIGVLIALQGWRMTVRANR